MKDASERYFAVSDVCSQHALAASSLQTLLGKAEKDLVIVPLGKGYIVSNELRSKTEQSIKELLRQSEEGQW